MSYHVINVVAEETKYIGRQKRINIFLTAANHFN